MTSTACVHDPRLNCRACRRSALRRKAMEALGEVSSLPVVDLTVDGLSLLAAFERCEAEHARRHALRQGAVTTTALLHGLWLLPHGLAISVSGIPDHKLDRLRAATHLVTLHDERLVRDYVPAGVVRAVAFAGASVDIALRRAARFTPIVQRFAVVSESVRVNQSAIEAAGSCGVGVLKVGKNSTQVLVEAATALKGVPAVYRWWIAELAYERWLYDNTQPVS